MPESLPMEEWSHGGWTIQGASLAGVSTCYSLLGVDAAFDVAQGFPQLVPISRFFITHGHMDHAAGIPYLISQRTLAHLAPATFYMPSSLVDTMRRIMNEWQKIEGHEYCYSFVPLKEGESVVLRRDLVVQPFTTYHRVESLGYTVFQKRKSLKPELSHLSPFQIRERKMRGEEVDRVEFYPEVSFTGDTRIEFFDDCEAVRRSRILVMEVTYIDKKKTVENAREWGHIHLDELIARLPFFSGEKILITHVSSRYSREFCQKIIDEKVPIPYRHKVDLLHRPISMKNME